jgi:hypothetical protein
MLGFYTPQAFGGLATAQRPALLSQSPASNAHMDHARQRRIVPETWPLPPQHSVASYESAHNLPPCLANFRRLRDRVSVTLG